MFLQNLLDNIEIFSLVTCSSVIVSKAEAEDFLDQPQKRASFPTISEEPDSDEIREEISSAIGERGEVGDQIYLKSATDSDTDYHKLLLLLRHETQPLQPTAYRINQSNGATLSDYYRYYYYTWLVYFLNLGWHRIFFCFILLKGFESSATLTATHHFLWNTNAIFCICLSFPFCE